MAEGKEKGRSRQPRTNPKLALLRQRFVEEYLVDCNGAAAARRAGYSPKGAHVQASQLLTEPAIQEALSKAFAERTKRVGLSAERVIEELMLIAFSDIGEVVRVDENGQVFVRQLDTLRPEARRAVESIKQETKEFWDADKGRVTEKVQLGVKLNSKVAALKMLVDHLGLNAPIKHDHTLEMQSARERLAAKLAEMASRHAGSSATSTQPG